MEGPEKKMPKCLFWSVCFAAALTGCGALHKSATPLHAEMLPEDSADQDARAGQEEGAEGLAGYSMEAYPAAMAVHDEEPGEAARVPQALRLRSESQESSPGRAQRVVQTIGANEKNAVIPNPAPEVSSGGEETPSTPMVVYTGFLELRVRRLLEAVDEITRITQEKGGYIESLTRDVVVVRIPSSDFDAVMDRFAAIGDVLSRRIKALDVSAQFTDLGARLLVAQEARDRLLELLEQAEDVDERLGILGEVKRLTEQIEALRSRLRTLTSLVSYFTIAIELQPVLDNSAIRVHRSAFAWVRNLRAHRMTIEDGKDEIAIELPKGFVFFEDDDAYKAQAADTTVMRAGRIENQPEGSAEFWSDAIHFEMEGRDEEPVGSGTAGPLSYRVYRSKDIKPRSYLIAVAPGGEDLFVVEVYYPNEEAFENHHQAVLEALATFRTR